MLIAKIECCWLAYGRIDVRTAIGFIIGKKREMCVGVYKI